VAAVKSELAAWAATRLARGGPRPNRRDTMAAILAAADAKTRSALIGQLGTNAVSSYSATVHEPARRGDAPDKTRFSQTVSAAGDAPTTSSKQPQVRTPLPAIHFDDLVHLDDQTLATLLREIDADALALALAGSGDELVDRICAQMPKRVAKTFRCELRRMGPTRLSDVEAAQRLMADHAARQLARRRERSASASGLYI
jgi:hypothetical protein